MSPSELSRHSSSPAEPVRAASSSAPEATETYVGEELPFGRVVWVDDNGVRRLLPLHGGAGSIGYVWGRAGNSARDLARSVLCHALGNDMLAERLCRDFTWEVIARLPNDSFRLPRSGVHAWVEGRSG